MAARYDWRGIILEGEINSNMVCPVFFRRGIWGGGALNKNTQISPLFVFFPSQPLHSVIKSNFTDNSKHGMLLFFSLSFSPLCILSLEMGMGVLYQMKLTPIKMGSSLSPCMYVHVYRLLDFCIVIKFFRNQWSMRFRLSRSGDLVVVMMIEEGKRGNGNRWSFCSITYLVWNQISPRITNQFMWLYST